MVYLTLLNQFSILSMVRLVEPEPDVLAQEGYSWSGDIVGEE